MGRRLKRAASPREERNPNRPTDSQSTDRSRLEGDVDMKATLLNLMKRITVLAVALVTAHAGAQDAGVLPTQKGKDSYAIGVDLARNLKRRGVQLEADALIRGMKDALSGEALLLSEDDVRETLRILQAEERQKQILARRSTAVVADQNLEQGTAFLEQNKTKSGVITLPTGLQYKILQAGNGQKPTKTDTIECRFRGTLIDGQEFAGSNPSGEPATFKMSEVIPGWKDALQLMPIGSKWQLFIPPQLAYGEEGIGRARLGPKIGPNATLIYELELLAIK
jgi:FKBP-type peptidyl-prolyl cis-trans isomerase FklB